jgi:serine/threonine-protein kinase
MSQPASDRNLLFGNLALQKDLVSKEALLRAVDAWMGNPLRPLADVLVEQGALADDARALLETLVADCPGPHGNGAAHGSPPAPLPCTPRPSLQPTVDPAPPAPPTTLPPQPAVQDAPARPAPAAVGEPTAAGLRFRILRPHAQGGLGQVSVALDEELRREVALKEIQQRLADDPASRARFLREAEVTGHLEHPGIVPVYGLGAYADGRPYYAMRFIKGDSFKGAIERFHRADTARRDVGERALELRQLLGRLVAVCNAVAYAHSRGVIHRDLKADNVMLGQYGETLVVDWGLAKVLGRPEEAAGPGEPLPALTPAGAATATQAGAIVGTPQFMPPEQAMGQQERLGPASDVYSLGAMLYHLLTGQPPFAGTDLVAVLIRVAEGDFPPPRQVKAAVPAALEAICLKAMARRPEQRYPTARALADDVEHWLADEPVSAWREPWRLRAGRWARRHRPLVAAAAAGVLVAVLAAGAGVWWRERQRAEQRQAVEAALDEVARLQAKARWAEARAVLAQAQERLGEGGPADLEGRLRRARHGLELVARLDAIRLKRASWVQDRFDTAGADRDYAAAFQEAGLGRVGDDPARVARRVADTGVRGAVVAALDDWAGCRPADARQAWVLAVARQADPDPVRDRLRDPKIWRDPAALARLTGRLPAGQLSPQMVTALGQQLGLRREPLLRAGQARYPADFWINLGLANDLYERAPAEAVAYYRAALAVRPDASVVHSNLGAALRAMGRVDEALACFRRAIELDPRDAYAHTNLGAVLRDRGRVDEAIAHFHRAIELDPRDAYPHNNLGNALKDKGQLEQAIAEYQKAVALDPKYALAHKNLAFALNQKGRVDEAIVYYRRATELDPRLTVAHTNLCLALMARGRHDEAIAACRRAIAIDPKDVAAHVNLGRSLITRGRLDEGIVCLRRAVDLDPKHAMAYTNLGIALKMKGQMEPALAAYHKAIASDPRYAQAHGGLGRLLVALGRFAEARQSLRRCGALLPAADPFQKWVEQQLHTCDQLLALEARLARVLQGKEQPADAGEQLALARLCARYKQLYGTAARLCANAFSARPGLADDLKANYRYNAASCAALAAAGQGQDGGQLTAPERARLRQQALAWLRADLALWTRVLDTGKPPARAAVQRQLQHWQRDPTLAGIRDAAWLVNLPEAELRACRRLWADVEMLLSRARARK